MRRGGLCERRYTYLTRSSEFCYLRITAYSLNTSP